MKALKLTGADVEAAENRFRRLEQGNAVGASLKNSAMRRHLYLRTPCVQQGGASCPVMQN